MAFLARLFVANCRRVVTEVIAYQRSKSEQLGKLGVQLIRADISDAGSLKKAVAGTDAVIHTAAKAGIWGEYNEYYRANVTGTQNVIAACLEKGVHQLVFTSSPSVTHADGDIEGGDESLPYPDHYTSPYPATKALAEQQVMAADCPDLHTVSLRPHLIWGPGDNHLLPHLLARAKSGRLRLPEPIN